MHESDIRNYFERLADSDQPPCRVSLPVARRRGRILAQRRLAFAAASPVLAAGAVLGIALTGSLPAGLLGSGHPPAAAAGQAALGSFSPLRPYVALGWRPTRRPGQINLDGRSSEIGFSGSRGQPEELIAFSAGSCRLAGRVLTCPAELGSLAPRRQHLGRVTGRVHGHPAYWLPEAYPFTVTARLSASGGMTSHTTGAEGSLQWQYARGSWAEILAPSSGTALRVARAARFGPDVAPPVRFPAQLTKVPAAWHVDSLTVTGTGASASEQYLVTAPGAVLEVTFAPGSHSKLACQYAVAPKHATTVINGYRVLTSHVTGWSTPHSTVRNLPPWQLCAPDADGVNVQMLLGSHPAIGIASLFAHHLRLLGPGPANWTTRPIAS